MKNLGLSIALMLLLTFGVKAQNNNQLSLQFSLNQVELSFQRKLFSQNVWGEAYAGIGNQDINSNFDDFLAGLRIGFDAFSNEKNSIGFITNVGFYIPNNDYYTAETPVIGVGIRYTRFIGKSNKHSLFVNAGYQYAKRDYQQEYYSKIINATTIGDFKIAQLFFSVGYGFKF